MTDPITVYIALGSNLGDRRTNLIDALSQMRHRVTIKHPSAVYETEPAYVTDQPRFYNMVLRGQTTLDPHSLLRFLQSVERHIGRERKVRYGPRLIDLDILAYGDQQVNDDNLIIPHPRLAERAFVLAPLAEIAPNLILPGLDASIDVLLQRLAGGGEGQVVQAMQTLPFDLPTST